jgi:nucleoside-diphosphate-sugar epimerase
MRVLITGATGFLGSRLVARLTEGGHDVRAVVRATSRTETIGGLGAECRVASLSTGQGLDKVIEGVDIVVHAAGGGRNRSKAQMYADNRDTTKTLLAACEGSDIKRFVHISSLAAAGPSKDGAAPHERAPTSHYGRSKAEAEDAVLAAESFPVTVLRPCAVYGPGDAAMAPLFRMASKGWLLLPGPGKGTAFVHVHDCVSAIVAAIEQDHPSGRVYGVAERVVRNEELPDIMERAAGSRPRVVKIPGPLLKTMGLVWDKAADLAQPYWICESAGIRDDLGWSPSIPIEHGFVQTMAWYREEGWV